MVGVHGRHVAPMSDGVPSVTAGTIPASVSLASLVIVAVRDAQLDAALTELNGAAIQPGAIVLHLSGSSNPEALGALRRAGHPCGTFHPLLPLAMATRAESILRGAWIGIDGDDRAMLAARGLAASLGANVLRIPEGEKPRYHAAAVFAANFPVVLSALASVLLVDAGVDREDAWAATVSLMQAAVGNIEASGPEAALTGPLRRGDAQTIASHLAALLREPEARAAYVALTKAAIPLAQRAGSPQAALDEVLQMLERER